MFLPQNCLTSDCRPFLLGQDSSGSFPFTKLRTLVTAVLHLGNWAFVLLNNSKPRLEAHCLSRFDHYTTPYNEYFRVALKKHSAVVGIKFAGVRMGYEYAFVHLNYTIPPAVILSVLYRPLFTWLDVYKVCFLITVAVVSTIPWDSYLIRNRIWTYPPDVIIGPTLFDIPLEEVFFFVIQTYNTSLLYLLLNKTTLHSIYLRAERPSTHLGGPLNAKWIYYRRGGQLALGFTLLTAFYMNNAGGRGTYMSLVIGWAVPFLLLLWTLAYQFLIGLPWTNTILPIAVSTLYLWIVDTIALRRGTWVIESGTKFGIHLWPGLEIEEAVFFFVTNALIVFGLVAFDNALAILYAFSPPDYVLPMLPSPILLIKALLKPASGYDQQRVDGLREAVQRLSQKSRSFYVASGAFEGKLRIYLVILYSFCRVADDLVDDASSSEESRVWITKLEQYLDRSYGYQQDQDSVADFIRDEFPVRAHSALLMLPTKILSKEPLYDLLKGFEMDLAFSTAKGSSFPISSESDLELYGARVAGTVSQLCLELVFSLLPNQTNAHVRDSLIQAGSRMGIALQYVNISRDIAVDANLNRVYIPSEWLEEVSLTPDDVLKSPRGRSILELRCKMLKKAFSIYDEAKGAINELPVEARGPMRVAVESYMEIGRVLQEGNSTLKHGRATVPKLRRMKVAWQALSSS